MNNHVPENEFLMDWFGNFGRILGNPPFRGRERYFSNNPNDIFECMEFSQENELPAFISVQPYSKYGTVMGIEKLFYDFDYGKKSDKLTEKQIERNKLRCAKEVQQFTYYLKKFHIEPLVLFSGNKGYHVYVYFDSVYTFDPDQYEFYKMVYKSIMERYRYKEFEFMDSSVIGDLQRFGRIPFSIHQKTNNKVVIVDKELKPDKIRGLNFYKTYGLNSKVIDEEISNTLKDIEKTRKRNEEIRNNKNSNWQKIHGYTGDIRPCFLERIKLGEMNHKQRLALLIEAFYSGLHSEEELVDVFRKFSDFNESKTRYQVKWYLSHKLDVHPYKCDTIDSEGWCLKEKCPIWRKRNEQH